MEGIELNSILLASRSRPSSLRYLDIIWPFESVSGTTFLNDLVNRTMPDSSVSSILSAMDLSIETSTSSPILCTSSMTMSDGVDLSPSKMRLEQIEGLGALAPCR